MSTNEIRRTPVIKLDLVNQIVERTGVSKTKAEQAVDTIFNCMKDALKANDRIELRGFGVFSVKPRKTGIGRNPRTGSEVNIPPGKAVRFKPGKDLQALYAFGVPRSPSASGIARSLNRRRTVCRRPGAK